MNSSKKGRTTHILPQRVGNPFFQELYGNIAPRREKFAPTQESAERQVSFNLEKKDTYPLQKERIWSV